MKNLLKSFLFFYFVGALSMHLSAQVNPENDSTGVCNTESIIIDVLQNDIGDDLFLNEIIIEPEHGDAEITDDNLFIEYTPEEDFIGFDVFLYVVENAAEEFGIAAVKVFVQDGFVCVWPGDANDDGIANNKDILNIGLYFGNVGPDRYDVDGSWNGSYCDDWNDDIFIEGVGDPRTADCNGDGIIDGNDTIPIISNYGEIHLKTTETEGGSELPPIYVDFYSDTILSGSEVIIPLKLGTLEFPASNVYGISFTISGGSELIVPGSLRVTFNSSWLGEPEADLIFLNYHDGTSSDYEVGVTRITHTSVTGYGTIGELSFVMEDDLAGKTTGITEQLKLCINNVLAINDFGQIIETNPLCDSIIIADKNTNIVDPSDLGLHIFPNPASEKIHIESNDEQLIWYSIMNCYGQQMFYPTMYSVQNAIDIHQLENGTYLIKILKGTISTYTTIIIQH